MAPLPTVRISDGHGGFIVINASDFNRSQHTLFGEAPAADDLTGSGAPDEAIANILNCPVAQVKTLLQDIVEVPFLQSLKDAEGAGQNRKGVLAAIDARNAELADPSE